MAIEALTGPQDHIDSNNKIYQVRRDKVHGRPRPTRASASFPPKAALYVWAKVPPGYTSESFTARLLDDLALVVTPGSSYGENGEGYIRLSLTTPRRNDRQRRSPPELLDHPHPIEASLLPLPP